MSIYYKWPLYTIRKWFSFDSMYTGDDIQVINESIKLLINKLTRQLLVLTHYINISGSLCSDTIMNANQTSATSLLDHALLEIPVHLFSWFPLNHNKYILVIWTPMLNLVKWLSSYAALWTLIPVLYCKNMYLNYPVYALVSLYFVLCPEHCWNC